MPNKVSRIYSIIKIDEYDRAEAEWIENVREKIDAAIAISEHTPPIDLPN
ncbi:hypothetical protein [[Phormidium ambiguum] IAM M-71]|nr:hypothetical protein [Phormidium ambiguum]